MPHRLRDRIKIIRQGIANSKSELANHHALIYSYQIISLFQDKYLKRLTKNTFWIFITNCTDSKPKLVQAVNKAIF
jgi:hypothetical protein